MNKIYSIIFVLLFFLISCKKDPEIPNNETDDLTSSILINYNNNQISQINHIPDSCLIYDTIKHIVYVNTNINPFYDYVSMQIFINLDSISYPFCFPKKNIICEDYYYDSPNSESQCARIAFYKIVPPDTSMISIFLMISADIISEVNLINYSNNYLSGNFHGILYCYHKTNGEFPANDEWPLLDSMTINSGIFKLKLLKE
jgi:hypothetical protein